MVYLRSFILPGRAREEARLYCHDYPFGIFPNLALHTISFENVTVFCGGNGTGKTTLLNVIAESLQLRRLGLFNTSEVFQTYCKMCDWDIYHDIAPAGSTIFTSDDVFAEILDRRQNNAIIEEQRKTASDVYAHERAEDFSGNLLQLRSLSDYDALDRRIRSRRLSKTQFVNADGGTYPLMDSNGQHALAFYKTHFQENALYLLDEPENSLSPVYQEELAAWITDCARVFGCQFIIASHSPFFLSLPHAVVYDFDSIPVTIRPWWENRNMQSWFRLFWENKDRFFQ